MLARNVLLAVGSLAVVIGLVLAVVWFRLSSAQTDAAAVVVVPAVSILVAARPIGIGTLLRVQDLAWKEIPASRVTAAHFVRGKAEETDFVGAVTRLMLRESDPLVAEAFVKPGDRDFLVATLAPGYRAVSIGVDAAQSGSGLMQPGDRVDVVLTQTFNAQGPSDPGRRSVSETVLHDLRIIAVDQTLNTSPKPADPKLGAIATEIRVPKTITLEVQEREAEMLLVAEQLGKIQLTLRGQQPSEGDVSGKDDIPPTWASDVSPALETLGTAAPGAKAQGTIEVIHGSKTDRRCPTPNGYVACP